MNNAPVLATILPNQTSVEDEAVSFVLPANAFTDVDGDALTLSATLSNGASLPYWLVFDAASGSFSGTPPQNVNGILNVMVTASDGSLSASSSFELEITPVNDAPVAADDIVGTSEFLVNEFTNSTQNNPSVTELANGNFVVTWQSRDQQQGDTSTTAIKAGIFDANGVEIVSEFRVNEFTNRDQSDPSVTALSNGNFIVTWSSRDWQQGDTSSTAIKARIFDADGNEVVSEFRVNEFTFGGQSNPSVTELANGHFVVTWQSSDQQQGDTSLAIKARTFDANGTGVVGEFRVNEFTDKQQELPSVTALANGNFVVTWQSFDQQQEDTHQAAIKARILDADGNEITSEFVVNEFHHLTQSNPNVTALADGNFVVTWQSFDGQQGDASNFAIKARIFDANGSEVVTEFLVNEFTNTAQIDPSVTALANGSFVVTWTSSDREQGDASGSAIKARIFDADGNEIVTEFLVNEFTNLSQSQPSVTALANGDFVVTWTSSDRQQGDTSNTAIKARVFDANGVAKSPSPITEDVVTLIDTATLLANDNDVDGDALTVTSVSTMSAHEATLTLNSNGTISYDPTGADAVQALAVGQTLTDTFTYTVKDGNGSESTATVSVVVHGRNETPIVGTDGDDTLTGNAGDDSLYGIAGDDSLWGNDGDDNLNGGAGNDQMWGGAGSDNLYGGGGSDSLWGNDGDDDLSGGIGRDNLYGGAGSDSLWGNEGDDNLSGGHGSDSLYGGAGNDSLWGNDGDDNLSGGLGRDSLYGGAGNDSLWGNDGDDILNGGAGNDQMWGGAGSDQFVFSDNFGRAVINDFEDGIDLIKVDIAGVSYSDLNLVVTAGVPLNGQGGGVFYNIWVSDHGSFTMSNFSVQNLTEDDFLFV
ncbi:cadherin-like domain-containing protein [uncultured Tateyamaria sp.]|uniref:Ig-like domain-containing protein n=1 Tax=uncultured Tateyamaria sp. TaxID=455651 RepID=UPI002606DC98|nr:cadherin-like domain-containing protein [uncultured Tateyamaria sp.]